MDRRKRRKLWEAFVLYWWFSDLDLGSAVFDVNIGVCGFPTQIVPDSSLFLKSAREDGCIEDEGMKMREIGVLDLDSGGTVLESVERLVCKSSYTDR